MESGVLALSSEEKCFFSAGARQKKLFFSLSSLFISVLRVPEEKLAVHNFWGWVLSGGSVSDDTYKQRSMWFQLYQRHWLQRQLTFSKTGLYMIALLKVILIDYKRHRAKTADLLIDRLVDEYIAQSGPNWLQKTLGKDSWPSHRQACR